MPIINVQMWLGRSDEDKEHLIGALTQAAVNTLGCPTDAVTVILTEVEKKHWGHGGIAYDKK